MMTPGGQGEYHCLTYLIRSSCMNTWVKLQFGAKNKMPKKKKILRKIFKGQEDKAADLRNVRAHVHLHVQMHVRTKSSVRQTPFVLLVILILFDISVFQTGFKSLLLLSFIHFLPWCVPSFHLSFIFPLCWDASLHFLPTAGRSFWTTHGGRT